MNERIEKLAEQATTIVEMVGPQGYTSSYANFDREKFAELIVRECVDIIQRESEKAIRNNTYMGDDVPASVTQWKIKEHFGV
jgi:hypothetical protein